MKKIVLTIILIILIIILVALSVFFMMNPVGKYPANEWHSRWECRRNHLAPILSALRSYKRSHDGKLPHDLEELVEKKILNKYDLICPSQHQRLQNDGYLKDGSSLTISSYRLLLPGHVFDELPNDTIIVKENIGNHPESNVGKEHYSEGYHILVKKQNLLNYEFVILTNQKNETVEVND